MPSQGEAEAVRQWLRDPVTVKIAMKLRSASKGALRRYDKAKPDEALRIQMLREVLNETIPAMIDAMLVNDEEKKAPLPKWRQWLGWK